MKVKCFVGRGLGENTYLYYDSDTNAAVVIDPGKGAGKAAMWAKDEKLDVKAVLFTHGHFDHIEGIYDFDAIFPNVPVYAGENESRLLADPALNGSATECDEAVSITEYNKARDNELFDFGGITLTAIYTPGHTEGGVCWLDDGAGVIFTGDTLFLRSVGATHYATGDWAALEKSIRERLYTLSEKIKVYPGHGARTTIEEEKYNNPHVNQQREETGE